MRKILTEEEISKREKRRGKIIGIFLLLIMVASTASFAFLYNDKNNSNTGNSASNVKNIGGKWVADINGQQFVFSSSPESVNETRLNIIPDLNQYYSKPLYIDAYNEEIYAEIASTLGRYSERAQYACYSDCENSSYIQKSCSDNLIVVKRSENNNVYQNSSCLFIEGNMKTTDAFLYRILGLN